jgi:putative acyl-CoA dehydrogenase
MPGDDDLRQRCRRCASAGPGARWLPKILSREYDPRSLPVEQKRGALVGMGMTEKQGGTDVRANTTRAEPLPPAEGAARFGAEGEGDVAIVGHKWFFSAPQSDAHLMLAQTDEGQRRPVSCFFVPRFLPDGSRNAIRVQRLKDKLGNRSNASSEVEFCGASAGWSARRARHSDHPGNGQPHPARLRAGQRRHHARRAVPRAAPRARPQRLRPPLAEQPLMQNVLADLALESEAATAFALRLARCFDRRTIRTKPLLGAS